MEVDHPQGPGAEPLQLDLQAYAAGYEGHAKTNRLCFIAKACAGQPLELEALKMAHDEFKKTENTKLYREVVDRIDGRAGEAYELDNVWVDDVDRRFSQRRDLLETELSAAKTSLVKEAVRLAHSAYGDVLYSRGDIPEAFRQHLRTRDYATSPQHVLSMCLNVVRCAIEMQQYMHVGIYVQKAEALKKEDVDQATLAKLKCALGISHLVGGKYKAAAKALTTLPAELGNSFADVASGSDFATYATLCALATMDRAELASSIIDSAPFRELLSLAPPQVQEAARHFHGSRYGPALTALAALRPLLVIDPFLAEHADHLYAAVRARALSLYTRPFASLDLNTMAAAFNTDVEALESELATLIASKEVDGRIDSHAKALFSKKVNARSTTFKHALTATEQYMQGTKSLLLRASMMRHDLIQRAPAGDRAPERPEVPGGSGRHGRPQMHGRERDRQEGRHRNRMGERDRFAMENLGSGSGSMESHDLVNAGGMLAD